MCHMPSFSYMNFRFCVFHRPEYVNLLTEKAYFSEDFAYHVRYVRNKYVLWSKVVKAFSNFI